MATSFRDSLPEEFVTNTISLCGVKGESWLDALPDLIGEIQDRWGVIASGPFPNIGYNYVAAAERPDGTPVVLKVAPPVENIEIFSESRYLRILKGTGAVKLLEEARELKAILIERALPGENLTQMFAHRKADAIAPAIDTLHRIRHVPPPENTDVILLDDWFDGLTRYAETAFPPDHAAKALDIYNRLSGQPRSTRYLHGDFHPDNIVSAVRSPFLVIDPKGMIGHIGYEIAVFLNNFHWWQENENGVRERLERAVRQFADAFDLDPFELRQWAFAQMVLSAWWTFDEMPDIYNNEVAKADIWDV